MQSHLVPLDRQHIGGFLMPAGLCAISVSAVSRSGCRDCGRNAVRQPLPISVPTILPKRGDTRHAMYSAEADTAMQNMLTDKNLTPNNVSQLDWGLFPVGGWLWGFPGPFIFRGILSSPILHTSPTGSCRVLAR